MTNKNFELALEFLFPSEGGYSNHKDDRGGATNMGITQATYNYYLQKNNLPKKDVKNITKTEAIDIYYDEYWKASGADKIEDPKMAIAVFDTAVLHGPSQAKIFYKKSNGNFNNFLEIRKQSYKKIIEKDKTQKTFYKGWNNRVDNLKKYANEINSVVNSEEKNVTLYGNVKKNNIIEKLKSILGLPIDFTSQNNKIPNGKIFTAEEIGKMTSDEFQANENAINNQLKEMGVPREYQAQEAVQNGTMIWVDSYSRDDGGFSVGRRVSVANPARKLEWDVTPTTTRIIQEGHL